MKIALFFLDGLLLFFFLQSGPAQSPADFPTFQGAVWALLLGLIVIVVWFLKTNAKKTDDRFSAIDGRFVTIDERFGTTDKETNDQISQLREKLNGFEKTVILQNGETKLHSQQQTFAMERNILSAINELKEHTNKEFATKSELKELRDQSTG